LIDAAPQQHAACKHHRRCDTDRHKFGRRLATGFRSAKLPDNSCGWHAWGSAAILRRIFLLAYASFRY